MRAAAEAVIKALLLDHAEGRRLLVVKGAEADILSAALHEPHAPSHDVRERNA